MELTVSLENNPFILLACIFAYGQTSSGKTYTMKGEKNNPGIIPLSLQEIRKYKQQHPEVAIQLKISYLEIYNEQVNDLLNPKNKNLQLQEITYGKSSQRNVIIKDLSKNITDSPSKAITLFETGELNRNYAETELNH